MPVTGPWTYSGDPSSSLRDQVRYLSSDNDAANPQVSDAEVDFTLAQAQLTLSDGSTVDRPYTAAAKVLLGLITRYIRTPQVRIGDITQTPSRQLQDLQAQYELVAAQARAREGAADTDLVLDPDVPLANALDRPPYFRPGQMDNPRGGTAPGDSGWGAGRFADDDLDEPGLLLGGLDH